MDIENTYFGSVILFKLPRFKDERGFFTEAFRQEEFDKFNIPKFVQDNHSFSHKNVLRGLHYQLCPKAMGKLIYCVHGEIFDVAVDLRNGSHAYGKWTGIYLNAEDEYTRLFYIPAGFAHGFIVKSETAHVIYKTTEYYSPEHERSIVYNDPDIGINWGCENIIVSEKDRNAKRLKEAEKNFEFGREEMLRHV